MPPSEKGRYDNESESEPDVPFAIKRHAYLERGTHTDGLSYRQAAWLKRNRKPNRHGKTRDGKTQEVMDIVSKLKSLGLGLRC
jgi:hypothetical protein